MIKGVNKKIIEINNTDSIYFEKAVFYLKPNVIELPYPVARDEAKKYIELLGLEDCEPKRKSHKTIKVIFIVLAIITIIIRLLLLFLWFFCKDCTKITAFTRQNKKYLL